MVRFFFAAKEKNEHTKTKKDIGKSYAFFILYKVRCREKDAEFGKRKKTNGFLFPKAYRVYAEW